eukprot:3826343-Alexandrium_andersonii.AAC.1
MARAVALGAWQLCQGVGLGSCLHAGQRSGARGGSAGTCLEVPGTSACARRSRELALRARQRSHRTGGPA